MTTPKAKLAGLALIAALCAGFTLGLTAPAWAGIGWDEAEAEAAYDAGDYATAVRKWRPLAKQGNAKAQFKLGRMYHFGWGVPQDNAKAAEWYDKAAEQGYAEAQFNLGFMYDDGLGVPQDYALAHMWYNLAASKWSLSKGRDLTAKARDRVAKKMTPEQIAEAQRVAREWMAAFEKRKKK